MIKITEKQEGTHEMPVFKMTEMTRIALQNANHQNDKKAY